MRERDEMIEEWKFYVTIPSTAHLGVDLPEFHRPLVPATLKELLEAAQTRSMRIPFADRFPGESPFFSGTCFISPFI